MTDLVRVVEAAYDLGAADEQAWLTRVADEVRQALGFVDGVVAYTYGIDERGWITPGAIAVPGASMELAQDILNPGDMGDEDTASVVRTHMHSGASLATEVVRAATTPAAEYRQRTLSARGFVDALTLNATDPTRRGCMFVAPLKTSPRLAPQLTSRYAKLGAHIAAGLRLRRAVTSLVDEAVIDRGNVAHATGEAKSASARTALRAAVRAADRARGALRTRDPELALATWRGLVAGRWSLVDRFEADGRRYWVAHPNAPDARDPRALTPRERQVAAFVALGHSNKLIAYELGISTSTVGVCGVRRRRRARGHARRSPPCSRAAYPSDRGSQRVEAPERGFDPSALRRRPASSSDRVRRSPRRGAARAQTRALRGVGGGSPAPRSRSPRRRSRGCRGR